MSKHTPGPWEVAHKTGRRRGYPVAAWGDLRVYGARSAALKSTEADARLIAAAPELLNRLRAHVEGCSCSSVCSNCRADLAILNKAEGK